MRGRSLSFGVSDSLSLTLTLLDDNVSWHGPLPVRFYQTPANISSLRFEKFLAIISLNELCPFSLFL